MRNSMKVEATVWRNTPDGQPQIIIQVPGALSVMVRIPQGVARDRATAMLNQAPSWKDEGEFLKVSETGWAE